MFLMNSTMNCKELIKWSGNKILIRTSIDQNVITIQKCNLSHVIPGNNYYILKNEGNKLINKLFVLSNIFEIEVSC